MNKLNLINFKNNGFELNPIIISTLFCNGIKAKNTAFLKHLCNYTKENNSKINHINLKRMESLMDNLKQKIINFVSFIIIPFVFIVNLVYKY